MEEPGGAVFTSRFIEKVKHGLSLLPLCHRCEFVTVEVFLLLGWETSLFSGAEDCFLCLVRRDGEQRGRFRGRGRV